MEYHALIAGLPVVKADDEKPRVTLQQFKDDYMPLLSKGDQRLVGLYLLRYDNRNLLSLLKGKEDYDNRALYTRRQLEEAVEAVRKSDTTDRQLPSYIYVFIEWYNNQQPPASPSQVGTLPEDELSHLYFTHALKADNEFVRKWFAFERDTNNLFTVFIGQRHGFDARPCVLGNDEVSEALRNNTSPDFGLSTSLPYYNEIKRIAHLTEAVDTERELDAFRFRWLADGTFFHYFTVEKVFAYVLMIDIIERWSRLDAETGQQVFRDLIDDISSKAELPEEFR